MKNNIKTKISKINKNFFCCNPKNILANYVWGHALYAKTS